MHMHEVNIGGEGAVTATFANDKPFSLICGPCAIESRDMALQTAEALKNITEKLDIGFIYKSSFDKANRTSVVSNRGVGMVEGLKILDEIRQQFSVPVLTDIHEAHQAEPVGEVVDVLQIPAFLCRQTDLLMAAAGTGKTVNVKKGQFLSPWEVQNITDKVSAGNNRNIMLTERGTSFGYNNLVVDMRSLRVMSQTGFPVIFDATHSVQSPGGNGSSSGGKREFVEPLARAAIAVGVAGVFMESHPNPDEAISDAANQVPMNKLEELLKTLKELDQIAKAQAYQDIPSAA